MGSILSRSSTPTPPPTWKPRTYFFYGILQVPETLRCFVADSTPNLRPAMVFGYKVYIKGGSVVMVKVEEPNTIDDACGSSRELHMVRGFAYDVKTEEDELSLIALEPHPYKSTPIEMYVDGENGKEGDWIQGKAFVWGGSIEGCVEGTYDVARMYPEPLESVIGDDASSLSELP